MLRWLALVFACSLYSFSEENTFQTYFFSPSLDTLQIADWKHPIYADYLLIQNHLNAKVDALLNTQIKNRPIKTDAYGWIIYRMAKLRAIVGTGDPIFDILYFNKDPEKKDKCIICYASCHAPQSDSDYPKALRCIIESLQTFGFDGHFIYRIGGWPNPQKERLKYADVPYGFKPFFFEEVRDLGYKKILWLDACSVPVKSIEPLFAFLENHPCCFFDVFCKEMSSLEMREKRYITQALNISRKRRYYEVLSQVVGLNLNHLKANELLDRWIEAAEKKVPFLESDQLPFAFLVNELDLLGGKLPHEYYVEGEPLNFTHPLMKPSAIIYHQYAFLRPDAVVPADFFRSLQ